MSESRGDAASEPSREELMSALFAQLVVQQANMAMMLLGKVPHPESGQAVKDLDAARLFIDQLEMLEEKTKGNLSREEASILKQNLMGLRLAFVQAVDSPQAKTQPKPQEAPPPATPSDTSGSAPGPASEEEHRKKFSKKY